MPTIINRNAWAVLLACLLLAAPRPCRADGKGKMWAAVVQAVGRLVNGDLTAAVAAAAKARAAHPAPELDALVGLVALRGGRPADARKQLAAAVAKGSTEPLVLYWAGRAALAAGQPGEALKRMEQALAVGGDLPQLRMGHALLLAARGQRAAAAESLRRVAAVEPNLLSPSLYPGPTQGAVELMAVLLRRLPDRTQLLRTQGHLLWRSGRPLAALSRFRDLLKLRAGDADALQMSAKCLATLGRQKQALALASQAIKRQPGQGAAWATRGEILLDQGQALRAVADLKKAVNVLPRDSRLLTRLGLACAAAEDHRCAYRYFQYALRRDGRNAEAHFGLASQLQHQGKLGNAKKLFNKAMDLDPANPRFYKGAAHLASVNKQPRLATRLLAEARAAQRSENKLKQLVKREMRVIKLQSAALDAVTASTGCAARCRAAVSKLPVKLRSFVRAYLASRSVKTPVNKRALQGILGPGSAARLLGGDATVMEISGRTLASKSYRLRKVLPMVRLSAFR